jgi:threonylcarbamoyladenosine tRNA methylthiotransferase MtaB
MAPADDSQGKMRVAFRTLGCRLNQYDTESMKALVVADLPVQVVPWQGEADVYVLNSCTVTGKADQECRRLARQVKRQHPRSKVVVAGCYAQTQSARLADIPEIDGVVGNGAKDHISDWLPAIVQGQRLVQAEDFPRRLGFTAPLIDSFDGRARAYVKVQDGCDLRCVYCLIWQARGPARSRPVPDVLDQLARLAENGYREVVLAGIHLGHYGRDLQPRLSLVDLLRDITARFPQLRLRLSSIHPNEVGAKLLSLWANRPQLRPHLHLSLQSGADSVLARMQRPYRAAAARQAVMAVAEKVAHCGIGADLIVGFPGETDAEFRQTLELVTELPFTYLHVFRFSPRPGTPAAAMRGQVHPETVTERSAVLRDLARQKRLTWLEQLHDQEREVVVESSTSDRGWYQGTTDNYASVLIPGRWREGSVVRCRLHWEPGEMTLQADAVEPMLLTGTREQ